ncbi:hypothetical protein E8E13_000266 [Curvularia kusanoi]|uniref:NmrA-like domain-containing protein n=1 Tax=Curvularia kusanoi TaxID=90978 RepID=A0A9P4T915_CURKU|nr:hypothetical protein E8E13_000266 [Curvularia kusanoi]
MNASATIRASYVRANRMSMMAPPGNTVLNPVADLESRPAISEKLANFVAVDHIEHRKQCDIERAKTYVYDKPSWLEWDDDHRSFGASLKKMFTTFPYRDPTWLVAVIFAVGSLDLVINAFLDLLPDLDRKLQFEANEKVALPTTILIGSILFFVAGIFDTFGALNADRGVLDADKVTHKVTYRPALLGTPEFKWIPSWVKFWDLTMTNHAFQAGLIVLFGGVIFMFAGIVAYPEVIPKGAPFAATIVFGPQVVHGALFLIANAMLAFSEQERWYKPKWWDADWQGAFLNTIGGFGFMMAGILLFKESERAAAAASLLGSWAFLIGSIIRCLEPVAIVTGATSGIGSWLADHLHKRGFRVAFCGRREEEGHEKASSLDASGASAVFIQCDVSSYNSQASMFQKVWHKWGRIDVLIANAGCVDRDSKYNFKRREASVNELPPIPDTSCTDIDFKGAVYGTTLATHFMRHNPNGKGGKIIVTGSMLGVYPCATFPEYCAAKAAVHQWVRGIGQVLHKKENITINCVMPGPIETSVMPGFSEAFLPHHMTQRSTLIAGYDIFLDDEKNFRSGQLIEAAHKDLIPWGHPGYKSGAFAKRSEKIYEPWFDLLHGERSELPQAMKGPPLQGPKIIVVTGATGSQGGGVVNVMKRQAGWKVRAVTRDTASEAAKKLAGEGIELVQADFDDEDSLREVFKDAHAIFAVTNWWEHLFRGKTRDEAGDIEEEQGMKLARAAAATETLEHYIWSTTPSAKRKFNSKLLTPHMDYKANVDARIKSELPALAAITTYLYFGYYPQNLAFFPLIKPIQHPGNGQYIQTLPTKPDAKILLSGDMTVNPGIWVRQILLTGERAFGKYANVALEKWTFQQMIDVWSEVTGRKGIFMETTIDAFTQLWGEAGHEIGLQMKFGEMCDPWEEDETFISPEDLGIDLKEVVGFTGTLESLKESL